MSVDTLSAVAVSEVEEVEEVEEVGTVKKERRPIDDGSIGILFDTVENAKANPVRYEDGEAVEKGYYLYKCAKYTYSGEGENRKVTAEQNVCFIWARNPIESLGHLAANKGYEADLAEAKKERVKTQYFTGTVYMKEEYKKRANEFIKTIVEPYIEKIKRLL